MRLANLAALSTAIAVASGGIALAAVESSNQPADPGRTLPSTAASQAQLHAGGVLAGHPSKSAVSGAHGRPQGKPSPNLNGLCHAWLAGAGSRHGKARSNPAFTALITAAGGSASVDGYCMTVVAAKSAAHRDEPSSEDSDAPHSHPNKTSHPGNSNHPAGKPTHP